MSDPAYKKKATVGNRTFIDGGLVTRSYDFQPRTIRAVDQIALRCGISKTDAVNHSIQIGAFVMSSMPPDIMAALTGVSMEEVFQKIWSPEKVIKLQIKAEVSE